MNEFLRDIAYKFALKNAVRNMCIFYLKQQGYTINRNLLNELEKIL